MSWSSILDDDSSSLTRRSSPSWDLSPVKFFASSAQHELSAPPPRPAGRQVPAHPPSLVDLLVPYSPILEALEKPIIVLKLPRLYMPQMYQCRSSKRTSTCPAGRQVPTHPPSLVDLLVPHSQSPIYCCKPCITIASPPGRQVPAHPPSLVDLLVLHSSYHIIS